jgi:hypothetical protein
VQGGQILSGLKRPAGGEFVADSGTRKRSDDDTAAARAAAVLISAAGLARRALGWLAARATNREISPGSLSGISVLMAVCAAGWFSGGTGEDGARGLLAMCGWLAFLLAGRGLAAFTSRQNQRPDTVGTAGAGAGTGAPDGGTDWLGLPAVSWSDNAPAGVTGWDEPGTLGFGWLAAVCAMAAECAIYGGMAAGDGQRGLIGPWPLAVVTISSVAIADLLGTCRAAALAPERGLELSRNPVLRAIGMLLRVPPALRGLLALVAYAFNGPQSALMAVLGLEGVAIIAAIVTLTAVVRAPWQAAPAQGARSAAGTAAASGRTAAPPTRITAIVGVAGSTGETTAVRFTTTPSAAWIAAGRRGTTGSAATGPAATGPAATGPAAARPAEVTTESRAVAGAPPPARIAGAPAAYGRDRILALRDDGAPARWAGRIVQGNLIPLPPALAGLIATAMLAALGLRHLPGFIALTPPVVMALAAPGSSHPHDSRSDWVVPVLLAAAQFVYLGSLGFALALPGPVVFSGCALVAIWYASVIASATTSAGPAATSARGDHPDATPGDQPGRVAPWGAGLGWETRMFLVGLAATFGLATFGYVGLAAYLGVLICRKVMTGYLVPREEDRQ